MRLHSDPNVTERAMLRRRLDILEREEIARQRKAIVYLEYRVEALMRMKGRVARVLNLLDEFDDADAYRSLTEVLRAWPSK